MSQDLWLNVLEQSQIAQNIFLLKLLSEQELHCAPGQFANVQIDGCYLRRPLSICFQSGTTLILIYKIVGRGTERLAQYVPGQLLRVLLPLGTGFHPVANAQSPLLLGGGVGIPPLFFLAKELKQSGQTPIAVLGFRTQTEAFWTQEFSGVCDTVVYTEDGSVGTKGRVPDVFLRYSCDAVYACGPEGMLRAIHDTCPTLPPGQVQFSFECRMACGFGVCMACSCVTTSGNKRLCTEGPVLQREEIVW